MHVTPKSPSETGREYALRILKSNIVSLELAPGSLVSENLLAAEMGLSRTPVREALMELAKIQIIEIFPQKRSRVAYIDYDQVEEARFMRNLLECAIIELVCQMRTDADLQILRENVVLQQFCLENNMQNRIMELDNQFHQELFRIAKKPQIYRMTSQISLHFDRVRTLALSAVKDIKIVEDHRKMVEAITAKDGETAKALMDKHLNRSRLDAQLIREAYPQYFRP